MNPLITVYIVNFNYGNFLTKAIESVLNQSYNNIQLLIYDNGSTDNSYEVLNKYSHLNIKKNQKQNLVPTINQALRDAHGEYIIRLDADDFFHENAIEILFNKIKSDERIAMVFGSYNVIDTQNKILYKRIRSFDNRRNKIFHNPAHGACSLIRTSVLKRIGRYDEHLKAQDGYFIWLKLVFNYTVIGVEDIIFSYRKHHKNLTSNRKKILESRMLIQENFLKDKDFSWENIFLFILVENFNSLNKINEFILSNGLLKENIIIVSPSIFTDNMGYKNIISENFIFKQDYFKKFLGSRSYEQIIYFNTRYNFAPPFLIKHLAYNNYIYESSKSIIVRPLENSIFYLNADGNEEIFLKSKVKREDNDYYINTGIGMSISNVIFNKTISYIEVSEEMNVRI